ncbi:hypothetical protein O9993_19150 [Vibrio lentus]|nr:hypothetical protein [Vibrio lentus]
MWLIATEGTLITVFDSDVVNVASTYMPIQRHWFCGHRAQFNVMCTRV